MRPLFVAVSALLLVGCSTTRTFTISTRPADATVSIDNVERGKGTVTVPLVFKDKNDTHTVLVSRLGYKDQEIPLTRDFDRDQIEVELRPRTRRVTFTVSPVPAMLKIDGKPLTTEPVSSISRELEFTVDAQDRWIPHKVTAERANYQPDDVVVSWLDNKTTYPLKLEPLTKDLVVTSDPSGAIVYINDAEVGPTPQVIEDHPFPVDPVTNEFVPQTLTLKKPGYPDVEMPIGWEEGKTEYAIDLTALQKEVRIVSDPPGATVRIEGKPLEKADDGASVAHLRFPPVNEKGELRTYKATAVLKNANSEWEPKELIIAWDEGKSEYGVKLKEILTRPVPLLSANFTRTPEGWEVAPKRTMTLAMKDVLEGSERGGATQITKLQPGTQIDTLAMSPEGQSIVFTILFSRDESDLRSQIVVIRADGSGGQEFFSDGKSLDIMPSYTGGGDEIVYSSNRAGKRLSIWSMSTIGQAGFTQLTQGDTNDLWPMIDVDPKQRLYYQALVDTRPDPRLYMTQRGTTIRKDLTHISGTQPRVSPKADSVIFCSMNEKTGKRDLYRMPDTGGAPLNLTNTPDIDEFDPSWSRDGSRVAFVSDRGQDEEKRQNYDIWTLSVERPQQPVQITTNGSHDDCPAWDPSGQSIYFRSNRGGEWAIWKIDVP
ncbi:MAG TPA: PEGA domain-containing protein [Tepidisphaeraceae bacterium]|nr:PEGA domain-containing protein [Tepidisphaeraceae bacterium]